MYIGQNPDKVDFQQRWTRVDFTTFFEIAGIACYSIEGIGLLFALRSDYLKLNSYSQFQRSYFCILIFTVLVYFCFTISNYLKFYEEIGQLVFFNYDYKNKFIFGLEICYLIVF